MDPITIAMGLASVAPSVVRWITGDDSNAAKVADQALSVARRIAGQEDPRQAVDAIRADPQLAMQFQQAWQAHELALYQAENERLATVNATMRAEVASQDGYVRRWRPTMGYCLTATWTALMLAVAVLAVWKPVEAPAVITALSGLSVMWGIALSVLGISVHQRSQDKRVAAGAPMGGVAGLLGRLRG